MKGLLAVEDVLLPTVVRLDGVVISDVTQVDILGSRVEVFLRDADGEFIIADGDFQTGWRKGQITLEFPAPCEDSPES